VTLYDKLAFSRRLSFLFTPVIQHLVSQHLLHQNFYFCQSSFLKWLPPLIWFLFIQWKPITLQKTMLFLRLRRFVLSCAWLTIEQHYSRNLGSHSLLLVVNLPLTIGCNTGTGKPAVFPKRVGQVRVRCWILTHRRTPRTRAAVLRVLTGLLQ